MKKIKEIAEKIEAEGGRLYIVGGAVRDRILKRKINDEDYCVAGITEEKFKELFPNAYIRGKSFAVFDLENKEFAMARTETKSGTGHKDFKVKTGKDITLEQDLARRDITINAIAEDVLTKEIIDPFGGVEDLKNKVIRATTPHFREDPLRVYRVARFSAELDFSVDKQTIKMMNDIKSELASLSAERVFAELKKALGTDKPRVFFDVLREADLLDIHFEEIKALIGAKQPVKYHPEGDAYNHTMLALERSVELTKNLEENQKLEIRFAVLAHDLGKGKTPKEEYPHHYGHEQRGIPEIAKFAKRLKMPNRWIKCGKFSAGEHMRGGIFNKMTPAKKVNFIEKTEKSILGLEGMKIVVICDKTSGNREFDISEVNFDMVGKRVLSKINGDYIKNKYGLLEGVELKDKLHQERIKWVKELEEE